MQLISIFPPAGAWVKNRIWMLLIAAAVDLLIGDPPGLWHPVQGIGKLVGATETALRRLFRVPPVQSGQNECTAKQNSTQDASARRERLAGSLLVLIVLLLSTSAALILLRVCRRIHPWCGILAEGILCGRLLALRSLGEAGLSVRDPLRTGDVEGARQAVSMIVGRDTDRLDAEGIAKAAVETVAENTSDGVTAPLFYMFLFGGPGGVFYKAVNTMDSMIGYRNDRYRYFGTAAARLDDVMNYIPSRLTALCMILACLLPPHKTRQKSVRIPDAAAAFRIWRRDRRKSPSPNSAQTESVCAGALHLRLLGDTWYFGKLHQKDEIGDGGHKAGPEDITWAVRLLYRTAVLLYAAGMLILTAAMAGAGI